MTQADEARPETSGQDRPSPQNAGAPAGLGGLLAMVFILVAAAIANIYLTQPVLPVLQREFGVSAAVASVTVSAVILGIALANLPFGWLADRFPVRHLILLGGLAVAGGGLVCAMTHNLAVFVAARFWQGLFIPALTTCLAAYLSRSLPLKHLNLVMGAYVAATVAGGLSGRLLGGWLHPPLHWRYAFVTTALLVLAVTLAARWRLSQDAEMSKVEPDLEGSWREALRRELWGPYLVAFGAMFVFASVFNYLPFYLSGPRFGLSTQAVTMMYLTYITGIIMGPTAGQLSNRIGNGATMILGSLVFAGALLGTLLPSLVAVVLALIGACAGFFSIHAAAAGCLNRMLTGSRGRANSLYILIYYLGGATGITASGLAYSLGGWPGVVFLGVAMLGVPFLVGLKEQGVCPFP